MEIFLCIACILAATPPPPWDQPRESVDAITVIVTVLVCVFYAAVLIGGIVLGLYEYRTAHDEHKETYNVDRDFNAIDMEVYHMYNTSMTDRTSNAFATLLVPRGRLTWACSVPAGC